MEKRKMQRLAKRSAALLLSTVVGLSGISYVPAAGTTAKAAGNAIEIASEAELAKIGKDSSHPMDGDYVLTKDLELSGDWTPIGGGSGAEYCMVTGNRVFSGTFDGQGHSISNLTISRTGSTAEFNQSGLFAMIGSDDSADYAEVKNLVFSDVDITQTLGKGDSIGALAGDVNGYVKIDNVAVLSGTITAVGGNGGDLLGMGGILGQTKTNSQGVSLTNLYNAATLSSNGDVGIASRIGGILGRIHRSATIGSIASSLNVGTVPETGYAINGVDNTTAVGNTVNITSCYYLEGKGKGTSATASITEAQLGSGEMVKALGDEYWTVSESGQIMPKVTEGKLVVPIPSPIFAEGDKASSVSENFTLPVSYEGGSGAASITWTSGNTDVISVDGAVATVHPVMADTQVTLTAVTSDGRTKEVTVTVVSNLSLKLDQEYAKPETAINAFVDRAPEGVEFTYTWTIDGKTVSDRASYTPSTSDLNKFITVTANLASDGSQVAVYKFYFSKLPVVYIDTKDGFGITSKTQYKDASMRIQGNETYNSVSTNLYDGATEIRGRGNSTWSTSYNKLPYKLKLDKKTDLFGFGESKHWALLANYMDESLLRNKISYDLSGTMGMNYLQSAHVELVLNGVYAGNYQLVGNVRIDNGRVDIFDWEDCAGDAAKAIRKAHSDTLTKADQDLLEDYLVENMSWITSQNGVTWRGVTYPRADYESVVPKDASGNVDVSGGFLFELDGYYDEVSRFKTAYEQPFMFKSPEFISPVTSNNYANCQELADYAKNYIQAVENSVHADDYYTSWQGERVHYTDLVDMDSLVRYFVLNEFFWNTETMKKSTYMYKDLGGKLYIGPVWDMDWTSNSLVSQEETWNYNVWMTKDRSNEAQKEQWYKYLIGDPYFAAKVYEVYQENKDNFENIIKTDGMIDQQKAYLQESGTANYQSSYLRNDIFYQQDSEFNRGVERLRTFLRNRKNWMDRQCASIETLFNSFGKKSVSKNMAVSANIEGEKTTSYTARVTNSSVSQVQFYINGILADTVAVSNGTAETTKSDSYLESGKINVVQVRGVSADGSLLANEMNYATFTKETQVEQLTGTVTIAGEVKTGSVLTAGVSEECNNTGTLTYQWLADGVAIEGATENVLQLDASLAGKKIMVRVGSSAEAGNLISAATEAVELIEVKNDHILIHQVYGGGANDGTPVSHSFIELYNPTDAEIDLSGYSLGYLSNGKNGAAAEEVKVSLTGKIPAHTSYLVRCEAQDDSTPDLIQCRIDVFDLEWTQTLDNKRYRMILYHGDQVEDAVSVNEGNVEGLALPDGTISKQKSIRRIGFADTNINRADFETVDYRTAASDNYPRSLADGEWGTKKPDPEPEPLEGKVSIRGNAIVGAVLYADQATTETDENNLSYQWMADGAELTGETKAFLKLTDQYIGKKLSVCVTSSVLTGKVASDSTEAVKAVKAQTEHLIINQVYGTGGKKTPAFSHSFIELYNPTADTVSLEGYKIQYRSGGEEAVCGLSGEIPANTSYLIRCGEEKAGSIYVIDSGDFEWNLEISNKQYAVVLLKNEVQVDGVSVNEAEVEGTALTDPVGDEIISKNKSIRRIAFIDTDVNVNDFEVLNYSKLPEELASETLPKKLADGAWGMTTEKPDNPDKPDNPNNPNNPDNPKIPEKIEQGKTYEKGNYYYRVTSLSKKTVAVVGIKKTSLTKVTVYNSVKLGDQDYKVTSVAASAFKGNKKITAANIGKYVETIGNSAFAGCPKLKKVTVKGNKLKTIGSKGFYQCKALKNITIKSKVLKKAGKNTFKGIHKKAVIRVPKAKYKAYTKLLAKKGQSKTVKIRK